MRQLNVLYAMSTHTKPCKAASEVENKLFNFSTLETWDWMLTARLGWILVGERGKSKEEKERKTDLSRSAGLLRKS
jgi:hypothetical protein